MNGDWSPTLERFLANMNSWEEISRRRFHENDENAHRLATFMLEGLAEFTMKTSGVAWPETDHAQYYVGLTVSFIRTQFLIVRCAESSNLIEAVTLLRKQVELVCRLHELDQAQGRKEPGRRTPQLENLKTELRKLYGTFSEVAHSTTKIHFQLLGRGGDERTQYLVSVFPKFSTNSYVILYQAGMVLQEFWIWLDNFNESTQRGWDLSGLRRCVSAAVGIMHSWNL